MSAFNDDPRANKPEEDPLADEVSCRILNHEVGGLILGITEKRLQTIRIRPNSSAQIQEPGTILALDDSTIINDVLGLIRYRNLSTNAQGSLPEVINLIIKDNPEPYLSFYNRAGNLSLKMHAFAILPGIGNKKALEMVDLRGRDGWEEFSKLDADCGIDGAKLLADRLAKEIADPHLEPRLVDLLLRQEE
jgi:putative nucleotide binding protein